jgi:hypothetical protein
MTSWPNCLGCSAPLPFRTKQKRGGILSLLLIKLWLCRQNHGRASPHRTGRRTSTARGGQGRRIHRRVCPHPPPPSSLHPRRPPHRHAAAIPANLLPHAGPPLRGCCRPAPSARRGHRRPAPSTCARPLLLVRRSGTRLQRPLGQGACCLSS